MLSPSYAETVGWIVVKKSKTRFYGFATPERHRKHFLLKVGIADGAILDLGLKRALVQGELYFRNVWDEMAGEGGRAVLGGIARGEMAGNFESVDDRTRAALARMARLEVICRVDEGNYTVKIPLVRRWILEYAPD